MAERHGYSMTVLFVVLLAGVFYLLQKYLYQRFWNTGISVSITFEKDEVTEGEGNTLFEVVENRKWLPLATLKVKFQCSKHLLFQGGKGSVVTDLYYRSDFFSVMPYQRITRSLKMECPQRGYYGIRGVDLVAADLFFSGELHDHFDIGDTFYVYPQPFSSVQMNHAMQKINGEVAVKRHVMEDPFTFRGIREYAPFDEMKAVNWKATAKTGELKVNSREHTGVKAVRIFLNLADNNILRRESLLETSIRICVRVATELLGQGIRVAVYANVADTLNGQLLLMENNTGRANLTDIYRGLARLNLEDTKPFGDCLQDKFLEESGMYTVVISPDRHEDFQEILVKYGQKDSFCWLCPTKEIQEESIFQELKKHCIMIMEEQE